MLLKENKFQSARPSPPFLEDRVLCDIERDGLVGSAKQGVVESLAKRGLTDTIFEGTQKRLKLTPRGRTLAHAQG